MNDETERMLDELTPRATPPLLRGQVLAAVGRELSERPSWRRRHRSGLAVAASLLLAVALNWAVAAREDRLQASARGILPLREQVTASRPPSTSDAIEAMRIYHEMIIHLANSRGMGDVRSQESTPMDRDRIRPSGGDRTSDQRRPGRAERFTA